MSTRGLSRRALAVLNACCDLERRGQTVSTENVRRLTGISSTSVTNYHLHKLADRGLLRTAEDVRHRRHILGVADLPGSPARDFADAIRILPLPDRVMIDLWFGDVVDAFLATYPPIEVEETVDPQEAITLGHALMLRRREPTR